MVGWEAVCVPCQHLVLQCSCSSVPLGSKPKICCEQAASCARCPLAATLSDCGHGGELRPPLLALRCRGLTRRKLPSGRWVERVCGSGRRPLRGSDCLCRRALKATRENYDMAPAMN